MWSATWSLAALSLIDYGLQRYRALRCGHRLVVRVRKQMVITQQRVCIGAGLIELQRLARQLGRAAQRCGR